MPDNESARPSPSSATSATKQPAHCDAGPPKCSACYFSTAGHHTSPNSHKPSTTRPTATAGTCKWPTALETRTVRCAISTTSRHDHEVLCGLDHVVAVGRLAAGGLCGLE